MTSTELNRRELLFSGVNIVNPKLFDPPDPVLMALLKSNAAVRVNNLTPHIDQYNRFAEIPVGIPAAPDYEIAPPDFILPKKYKHLDITAYLDSLLIDDVAQLSKEVQLEYVTRYDEEIEWFKTHNKLNLLRVLVYIIDVLDNNNVVWGAGRGSSVSSYILYLIGVHDIHPIEYGLNWREFLRDD